MAQADYDALIASKSEGDDFLQKENVSKALATYDKLLKAIGAAKFAPTGAAYVDVVLDVIKVHGNISLCLLKQGDWVNCVQQLTFICALLERLPVQRNDLLTDKYLLRRATAWYELRMPSRALSDVYSVRRPSEQSKELAKKCEDAFDARMTTHARAPPMTRSFQMLTGGGGTGGGDADWKTEAVIGKKVFTLNAHALTVRLVGDDGKAVDVELYEKPKTVAWPPADDGDVLVPYLAEGSVALVMLTTRYIAVWAWMREEQKWEALKDNTGPFETPMARTSATVVVNGHSVYVWGGMLHSGKCSNQLHRFSFKTRRWTRLLVESTATLDSPLPRMHAFGFIDNGTLIVGHGHVGRKFAPVVEGNSFDIGVPFSDVWATELPADDLWPEQQSKGIDAMPVEAVGWSQDGSDEYHDAQDKIDTDETGCHTPKMRRFARYHRSFKSITGVTKFSISWRCVTYGEVLPDEASARYKSAFIVLPGKQKAAGLIVSGLTENNERWRLTGKPQSRAVPPPIKHADMFEVTAIGMRRIKLPLPNIDLGKAILEKSHAIETQPNRFRCHLRTETGVSHYFWVTTCDDAQWKKHMEERALPCHIK